MAKLPFEFIYKSRNNGSYRVNIAGMDDEDI